MTRRADRVDASAARPGSGALARAGLIATAVLVLGDLALRLAPLLAGSGGDPDLFGTALIGAAFACVAGLCVRRAPAGALVAATVAAALAALDVVGIAQAERLALDPAHWRPWLTLAELALLMAAGVAGAAAAALGARERSTLRRAVLVLAVVGVGAVAVLVAAVVVQPPTVAADGLPDSAGIRISGRAALGFCALALAAALGLAGRGPVSRAREAASAAGPTPTGRAAAFGTVLADELFRRPSRRQVESEERARLAADIHARLLPGLRRAAQAASEPGVPTAVADDLRAAVADAETLMEARESVVLESFGLVAALEWLAERTEDRDRVEVAIDLDRAGSAAEPPRPIARAALRVALLAVDNAVRHGRPSAIGIAVRSEAATVRLSVSDDGSGFGAGTLGAAGALDRKGRGIRDMTSLAASIGGSLDIHPGPGDRGTVVELTWPAPSAAGNPAMPARTTTDGAPGTPA